MEESMEGLRGIKLSKVNNGVGERGNSCYLSCTREEEGEGYLYPPQKIEPLHPEFRPEIPPKSEISELNFRFQSVPLFREKLRESDIPIHSESDIPSD